MMNSATSRIDITNDPVLRRLAHAVRTANKPHLLREDMMDLVEIRPVGTTRKQPAKRKRTPADYEAFESSFGAWRGVVDPDEVQCAMAESRRIAPRPPQWRNALRVPEYAARGIHEW